jgi:predicted Rossmann fold nucleotide-binding protein DprA/Smf involved in DNA uptake
MKEDYSQDVDSPEEAPMKFRFLVLASVLLSMLAMGGQRRNPANVAALSTWDPMDNRPQAQVTAERKPEYAAQLRRDAQELARLAQLIPAEIHQVESGVLPKDLDGQLKRIERLSKNLRREISR